MQNRPNYGDLMNVTPDRCSWIYNNHRSKTIWDRFCLADTPIILGFSILTAFHTLLLLNFPHFQPPHCQDISWP